MVELFSKPSTLKWNKMVPLNVSRLYLVPCWRLLRQTKSQARVPSRREKPHVSKPSKILMSTSRECRPPKLTMKSKYLSRRNKSKISRIRCRRGRKSSNETKPAYRSCSPRVKRNTKSSPKEEKKWLNSLMHYRRPRVSSPNWRVVHSCRQPYSLNLRLITLKLETCFLRRTHSRHSLRFLWRSLATQTYKPIKRPCRSSSISLMSSLKVSTRYKSRRCSPMMREPNSIKRMCRDFNKRTLDWRTPTPMIKPL